MWPIPRRLMWPIPRRLMWPIPRRIASREGLVAARAGLVLAAERPCRPERIACPKGPSRLPPLPERTACARPPHAPSSFALLLCPPPLPSSFALLLCPPALLFSFALLLISYIFIFLVYSDIVRVYPDIRGYA